MGVFSPKIPDLPPPPPAPPPPPDASEQSILASTLAMQTMARARLGYKSTFRAGARGQGGGLPPQNPADALPAMQPTDSSAAAVGTANQNLPFSQRYPGLGGGAGPSGRVPLLLR